MLPQPSDPHVGPVLRDAPRRSSAMLPAVVLVATVVLGVLGQGVPGADPTSREAKASGEPSPDRGPRSTPGTGWRLTVPVADVLWRGATEIAARGEVPPGVAAVDAIVVADGVPLGTSTLDVDASGRFEGVVAITPPAERTAARLEVRETGLEGPPMAEVGFWVEAGSAVLILHGSSLRARVGETTFLDVLVYEPLHEIRALVTSRGGTLIAEATAPATPRELRTRAAPVTVMLRIAVPAHVRPSLARLHVLALDRSGREVAHIDANLLIAPVE